MDKRTRSLVIAGITGAVYAALTMFLAPISYGAVQFRISEALCVLPFFCPATAVGLAIGCMIANLLSTAGILDIVFGAMATLLASLCVARLGKSYRKTGVLPSIAECALACAMPVLFNGPIIGVVLALTLTPGSFWSGFWLFLFQVAVGEAGVMFLIGIPLMRRLPRTTVFQKLCSDTASEMKI